MPPTGYKRSRALWDETRHSEATWRDWLRAVAYELQPVRFSRSSQEQYRQSVLYTIQTLAHVIRSVPGIIRAFIAFLQSRTRQHWLIVAGVIVYYLIVRAVHSLLDAGPLVVIVTGLVLIFTVGLNDETNVDGISAYAVFNRGFERLLGSVDVDALLAQHVGGGLGAGEVLAANNHHADGNVAAVARRPAMEDDNDEHLHDDNDQIDNDNDAPAENNNRNRSRKSGKKIRRRNLEQRQEVRRQREAAIALGMQGGEGPEELMAMQRLLEEQIAADNEQQ